MTGQGAIAWSGQVSSDMKLPARAYASDGDRVKAEAYQSRLSMGEKALQSTGNWTGPHSVAMVTRWRSSKLASTSTCATAKRRDPHQGHGVLVRHGDADPRRVQASASSAANLAGGGLKRGHHQAQRERPARRHRRQVDPGLGCLGCLGTRPSHQLRQATELVGRIDHLRRDASAHGSPDGAGVQNMLAMLDHCVMALLNNESPTAFAMDDKREPPEPADEAPEALAPAQANEEPSRSVPAPTAPPSCKTVAAFRGV